MATLKQKRAVEKVVENGGNITKAMREVGYSEATLNNPKVLTKSKGFQSLLNKYLPDNHLLTKHREFLDSKRLIRIYKKGDLETETEETDPSAVKALDMAYKVKKLYSEDPGQQQITINLIKVTQDGLDRRTIQTKTIPARNP